jgi:hypothetical protein
VLADALAHPFATEQDCREGPVATDKEQVAPEPPKTDLAIIAEQCAEIDRRAGVVFADNPPSEVPKCEGCAHYGDATGIAVYCVATGQLEALAKARGTDGACGPTGRLFARKGEVKT